MSNLKFENQTNLEPRMAMIFCNDCEYIVMHMLTLGYQFQERLQMGTNETITFLDMVPNTRNFEETVFKNMMVW
jgi:hypothetical protein